MFSILIVSSGCGLFSATPGDEVIYAPTEVGTPIGDKVTKDIGPAGGTLSSSDGRLTLTVPQNAVSESVSFSIQPISNNVEDGVGLAYRLEPSGKTFNAPVLISVKYTEQDVEGTDPRGLRLAYQDENGAWHEKSSSEADLTNGQISVSTNHLSDWAAKRGVKSAGLLPQRVTLRVGKSVGLEVSRCEQPAYNQGEKKCQPVNECTWKLEGPGTLTQRGSQMIYTAPARIERSPTAATAICSVTDVWPGWGKSHYSSNILIMNPVYQAKGEGGGLTYTGVICSLEHPFTVYGSGYGMTWKFTPTSPSGGMLDISASGNYYTVKGKGSYAVEGIDTDQPRIALTGIATVTVPYGSGTVGGRTAYLDLVPLDWTGECVNSDPPPPYPPPDPRLQQKRGL